jgi:hypothetical protein
MCGPKARTPNHGTAARSIVIRGGSVNSQVDRICLLAPQPAELPALAQFQQEGADGPAAPVGRVERGIEMPGAIASGKEIGTRRHDRREVAMDEAGSPVPDEPRLELAEVGVVAAFDMVEERHRVGDSIPSRA